MSTEEMADVKRFNCVFKQTKWFLLFLLLFSSVTAMSAIKIIQHTVVGHAPVISNITFDKTAPKVGDTVTVSADVTDPDGDTLNPLEYQWMTGNTPLSGETQSTYIIGHSNRIADSLLLQGNYKLKVKITAKTDPNQTDPAMAEGTSGDLLPFFDPDAGRSELTVSVASIPADNTTVSTISFTPKDAAGHVIPGITASMVSVDISGLTTGFYTAGPVAKATNSDAFTTTLKGIKAGTATVKVKINGTELAGKSTSVTLTPLVIRFNLGTAYHKDGSIIAGGKGLFRGRGVIDAGLTIANQDGNSVRGNTVTFNEAGGTHGLIIEGSEVMSMTPGSYKVMASIDGHPITDLGAHITYTYSQATWGGQVIQLSGPDDMVVTVLPNIPLVAHTDVTSVIGQTGMSAAATGGNTDGSRKIVYSSDDTSKVEVDANTGALTLKAVTGSTPVIITATVRVLDEQYGPQTVTTKVTVLPAVIPLVAHTDVTGYIGQAGLTTGATGGNTDGTHPIVYSSSDSSVVAVDASNGVLTLNKVGTASITATVAAHDVYPEQTVTTKVTLLPAVIPLVAHTDVTGYIGQTGLTAVATGGNTDGTHPIVYSSSDSSVVAVDASTGVLTLNKVGTASITATVAAHAPYPEQTVTVLVAVKGVDIALSTLTATPIRPVVNTPVTVTLELKDANKIAMAGQSGLALTGTDETIAPVFVEGASNKGTYVATFTPNNVKEYTLGVSGLSGFTKTVKVMVFNVDTAAIDPTQSTLTTDRSQLPADDQTQATLTYTPKDNNGAVLTNVQQSHMFVALWGGGWSHPTGITKRSDGSFTMTLTCGIGAEGRTINAMMRADGKDSAARSVSINCHQK